MVSNTGLHSTPHIEPSASWLGEAAVARSRAEGIDVVARPPAPADGGALRRPLVLIIDDDPAVREMLALAVSRLGALTIAAANGLDGLRVAHRRAPDAIVTDLSMPGLDGSTLVGRLRATPWGRDVPVVVFSGQERETGPSHEALEHPGVVLVSKGAGLGPVLAHLASVLGIGTTSPGIAR